MQLGTQLGFQRTFRKSKPPVLLTLPTAFTARWNPSFNIFESGRVYSTDFDIASVKPTGTTKWVAKNGNDTTGDGSEGNPYATLAKAYTVGATVVMVRAGIYNRTDGFAANFNPTTNIAVISADGAGKAILTRSVTGLTWTQQASPNDNVYLATRSTVRTIIDTTATGRSGEYLKDGITPVPIPLSVQTSIANCQANPGSWYQSGSNLYVRTFDGRAPDSNILVMLIENIWTPTNPVTIYLDGIENWGDAGARMVLSADNTAIWAWKNSASRFCGSLSNGLHVDGANYCYSINCAISDIMGAVDGFNYHATLTTTTRTKALEVNCTVRRCGASGQTTNNGSTAHDNCSVIRLNGNYQYTYGPVVVDVLGAMSVNLGCTSGNSLVATNSLPKCAYQVGTVSTIDGTTSKMWVKNCTSIGTYYDREQATGGEFYDWGGFIGAGYGGDNGTLTSYS